MKKRRTTTTRHHHENMPHLSFISPFSKYEQRQAFKKPLEVWQNHFLMNIWHIKSLLRVQHVSWRLSTANHWFTSFCLFVGVEMVYLTLNNVLNEHYIYKSRERVPFEYILWPFREWEWTSDTSPQYATMPMIKEEANKSVWIWRLLFSILFTINHWRVWRWSFFFEWRFEHWSCRHLFVMWWCRMAYAIKEACRKKSRMETMRIKIDVFTPTLTKWWCGEPVNGEPRQCLLRCCVEIYSPSL
jgi:hypothetical protein